MIRAHWMVLPALWLLTGCASPDWNRQVYPGPLLLPAEVARVEFPSEIDLLRVDGESVPSPGLFSTARRKSIELLPGTHRLVARYYAPFADGEGGLSTVQKGPLTQLDFAATAGTTYLLVYDLPEGASGDVRPRLVHAGTREPVPPARYTPPAESAGDSSAANVSLNRLQAAWERADETDRAAFRAWLETH